MRNDLGLLALRLSGLLLAFGHGWGKAVALAGGETRFIEAVANLGFPAPALFAWAAAISELGGGLCVALGLGTRYAAALAGFTMVVGGFIRHKAHLQLLVLLGLLNTDEKIVDSWGDPELALLYLLIMLGIGLMGPGRLALDRFVRIGR